jgi:hypothetical protein
MNGSVDCFGSKRDHLTGKLADVAFAVTARHGVRGLSVERELELWHSLGDVVRESSCAADHREDLLAELTDAAYQVALAHGTAQPFVNLELDLWRSLRQTLTGTVSRAGDSGMFDRAAKS